MLCCLLQKRVKQTGTEKLKARQGCGRKNVQRLRKRFNRLPLSYSGQEASEVCNTCGEEGEGIAETGLI
jgi:hypothetical protein